MLMKSQERLTKITSMHKEKLLYFPVLLGFVYFK